MKRIWQYTQSLWGGSGYRSRQRGDTIVEVLFAIAILGAVLGGAYVVVSRNITTNRASQERLEAVKLAETQSERLKVKSVTDPTVLTKTNFCMTAGNTALDGAATHTGCKVDATGTPTTTDPQYRIVITNDASLPQGGVRYKITVVWQSVQGSTDDTLEYYYEVYP